MDKYWICMKWLEDLCLPFIPILLRRDLRSAWMSSKALSPCLISMPEWILWMLMELGNVIWSSGRLVITTLNLFKWSAWVQRLSVRKRLWRSSLPDSSCRRPPHSSNASITITGSSLRKISLPSMDSGSSMSALNSRSMSDELCPWMPWVKCGRREG